MSASTPRQRRQVSSETGSPLSPSATSPLLSKQLKARSPKPAPAPKPAPVWTRGWTYKAIVGVVATLAFITRFYGISHPDQVVFDEVHFGKFASLYLNRTYFFDVHPPFAKLLFAFVGWLSGYDGKFLFDNIGDSYITNEVPYINYRALPALLGSLTVIVVFLTMKESGYSFFSCALATILFLFDNAQVGQSRLILLDAALIFSMSLSIYCYVRFSKMRAEPFSVKWWKWLLLTGISLSLVVSTKYVGIFTFVSIGLPVVLDLWDLLNVNRPAGQLSVPEFFLHLASRATALIALPFIIYLFWFGVHFAVLTHSGPGDNFMSPQFQETLRENPLAKNSTYIQFGDTITIRHKDTAAYLHSHPDRYPLRYEDGRISSNGQQVTGYPHRDTNNDWQILPADKSDPVNVGVKNNDLVRLRHVVTDTFLLTHDVASPYFPTNQEFTTTDPESAYGSRVNNTLFSIKIKNGKKNTKLKTMTSHFKVLQPGVVAMWTHSKLLPDWGHGQFEINGNKQMHEDSNLWYSDAITSIKEDDARLKRELKKPKKLNFFLKWWELQILMFRHNNKLTGTHPYQTGPHQWPFLYRGISFWTHTGTRQQIYFMGNPLGWLIGSVSIILVSSFMMTDQIALRRGYDALDSALRSKLYNSTAFFLLVWGAHYFPFFLMGRQLFLHHYLPAHLASCLAAGALFDIIYQAPPPSGLEKKTDEPVERSESGWARYVAFFLVTAVTLFGFYCFSPMTYGKPGLDKDRVLWLKWLSSYDFHFAK